MQKPTWSEGGYMMRKAEPTKEQAEDALREIERTLVEGGVYGRNTGRTLRRIEHFISQAQPTPELERLAEMDSLMADADVRDTIGPRAGGQRTNAMGACACGRNVVPRWQYAEVGRERHSRRRCLVGSVYVYGARW